MSVKVRWVAHSTFELRTDGGVRIAIDPFYSGNRLTDAPVPEVDWVLITHDHGDHVADAPEAAKKGAKLVVQPETAARFATQLGVAQERLVGMNIGGTVRLGDDAEATMIHAFHSSDTGEPAGYIMRLGGVTVAHLGDTGLFSDLRMFGELHSIDVAMIPIGGHFTMDARAAAKAVAWLGARVAIPMHYRTFPVLAQSADEFVEAVKREAPGTEVWAPDPGGERAFSPAVPRQDAVFRNAPQAPGTS